MLLIFYFLKKKQKGLRVIFQAMVLGAFADAFIIDPGQISNPQSAILNVTKVTILSKPREGEV